MNPETFVPAMVGKMEGAPLRTIAGAIPQNRNKERSISGNLTLRQGTKHHLVRKPTVQLSTPSI